MSHPNGPEPIPASPAAALVREGWDHLRLQRPLAAWGSWQRALRLDPDDDDAREALDRLANLGELPAAARAEYRFQTPSDPARRARWDARLRVGALDELAAAAGAFAALAAEDRDDAEARLNLALCHAWLGRNAEAIAALDEAVALLAPTRPDRAADAWALAEVLRLGAGAEPLADDLRFAWVVDWSEGQGPPAGLVASWPNLVPVALPGDPAAAAPRVEGASAYEWLDRPVPAAAPAAADDLPRVLASVVLTPRVLRVSSPDPSGFAALGGPALAAVERVLRPARREKTPLPIAWADAALGTFRLPAGLDEPARARLARAAVEHYHEDLWVHQPRQALGGRTPLQASGLAARGDHVARAKLAGVVRFREQLGTRPTHAAAYQGYPFDRLRRRLGLIPAEDVPAALDPDDLSCASGPELDRLDPPALDVPRLAEAVRSASWLGDDARTARLAAELARREPPEFAGLDPSAVFAVLVREALRLGDPEGALAWLARARSVADGPHARTFAVWSAEVHARTGRPDAALQVYQELLSSPDAGSAAALALDGAETLLDNGYPDHALPLLLDARSRARSSGDHATLARAESLLRRDGPAPP